MYLRCGGVVNNQVKKGLLLSLPVKKIIIGEHLSKLQARTRLSPAICSSFSCVVARRTNCNWKYVSPQAQRRTWSKRIKNIWRSDVRTVVPKMIADRQTHRQTRSSQQGLYSVMTTSSHKNQQNTFQHKETDTHKKIGLHKIHILTTDKNWR